MVLSMSTVFGSENDVFSEVMKPFEYIFGILWFLLGEGDYVFVKVYLKRETVNFGLESFF
jgi:hypothetical protein